MLQNFFIYIFKSSVRINFHPQISPSITIRIVDSIILRLNLILPRIDLWAHRCMRHVFLVFLQISLQNRIIVVVQTVVVLSQLMLLL